MEIKKLNNEKMFNKKNPFIIILFVFVVFSIKFSLASTGPCSLIQSDPEGINLDFLKINYYNGQGIYYDPKEGLTTDPGAGNLASKEQLLLNPEFVLKHQEYLTLDQRGEFAQEYLKNFKIKGGGNELYRVTFSKKGEAFSYDDGNGNKIIFTEENLKGVKSIHFNKNIVTLSYENRNIKLDLSKNEGPLLFKGLNCNIPTNLQRSPVEAPGCADGSCGGPGGSGGSGGGGEGGAGGGSAEQSLQVAQQLAGLVSSLLGPLLESLKNKANRGLEEPRDVLFAGGNGNYKPSNNEEEIKVDNGGIAVVNPGRNNELTFAQNDLNNPAYLKLGKGLTNVETGNSIFVFDKVAAASTPQNPPTKLFLNPAPGNFQPTEELESKSGITAAVIYPIQKDSGQYIFLEGYNADINGEKIGFYPLKNFDEIKLGGSSLVLISGKKKFEFNGPRTYLDRIPYEESYYVNKVINKKDDKNYFRILMKRTSGKYVVSEDKRFSSGDDIIENPLIKGLWIAKGREEMWKKAAGMI